MAMAQQPHLMHHQPAPPGKLSDVPLHDDDKKQQAGDQQQLHMESQSGASQDPRKDFVYKVPLPLPANHPSRTSKRHRRSPCCCCLAWLCSVLLTITLLLAIAMLVFYLVDKPRVPKYTVEDLRISKFNVTGQPTSKTSTSQEEAGLYLSLEALLRISAWNPNKKLGIYHGDMTVSVFYEGVLISHGTIAPFYQGHKNTTMLQLDLHGNDVALKQDVGTSLKKSLVAKASVPLQMEAMAVVAIKLIGAWKSSHVKLSVICSILITSPTSSGNAEALSKSCNVKVSSRSLPFLLLSASSRPTI